MMFNRRLLLGILATIACATAQPSSTVAYTSIQGASYNLYPWFGQKIVILTRSNSLDPSVMAKMVSALDAAFVIYESITGSDPSPYPPTTLNGRDTIAEVPDGTTCGAGCTYIGANGSELASTYFTVLYNGVALHDEYDQVMFYEFGRSFWFYNPPLGKVDSFVTGFAIANRFTSMERIPVKGGPFNNLSFAVIPSLLTF
jgi:serralysin